MAEENIEPLLQTYIREYANDPDFTAEGLSIKIVEELLSLLEERGLSQSWLAERMGVSRAHISKILNARPNMTLTTIAKIATALSVTPDVSLNASSMQPVGPRSKPEYVRVSDKREAYGGAKTYKGSGCKQPGKANRRNSLHRTSRPDGGS